MNHNGYSSRIRDELNIRRNLNVQDLADKTLLPSSVEDLIYHTAQKCAELDAQIEEAISSAITLSSIICAGISDGTTPPPVPYFIRIL